MHSFSLATENTQDAFLYIRSIATAYKHLYPDGVIWEVSSAGTMYSIPTSDPESNLEVTLEGENSGETGVHFRTRDGAEHEFRSVLKCVVEFWDDFLSAADG